MIKQLLLFSLVFAYGSKSFSMHDDSESSFKGRVALLIATGASKEKIANFANDYLDYFLENSSHRGLCKESYPLELYMEQFNQFVQAGADKNVRLNFTQTTALMYAARANRSDIFSALIAIGVDPTLTDREGKTAGQQPHANEEIKGLHKDAVKAWQCKK